MLDLPSFGTQPSVVSVQKYTMAIYGRGIPPHLGHTLPGGRGLHTVFHRAGFVVSEGSRESLWVLLFLSVVEPLSVGTPEVLHCCTVKKGVPGEAHSHPLLTL